MGRFGAGMAAGKDEWTRMATSTIIACGNGGTVLRAWRKPAPGAPMRQLDEMTLQRGTGIEGDAGASAASPRQVLVVRQEDLDAHGLPPAYLRENLSLVGLPEAAFAPGAIVRFDGGAALRLLFHCEPCAQIAGLVPRLSAIAGRRGILAIVEQGGTIAPGAAVSVDAHRAAALPDAPGERVGAILACIPPGVVLTYSTLLEAAGLRTAYARAIPAYLRAAMLRGLPAWRTVDSRARIAPGNLANTERLRGEGVVFLPPGADGRVRVAAASLWAPRIADLLGPA
jgi:alkylated DNA nucleotide flippase Atl1